MFSQLNLIENKNLVILSFYSKKTIVLNDLTNGQIIKKIKFYNSVKLTHLYMNSILFIFGHSVLILIDLFTFEKYTKKGTNFYYIGKTRPKVFKVSL